jgi:hypothetical protein
MGPPNQQNYISMALSPLKEYLMEAVGEQEAGLSMSPSCSSL